MSDPYRKVQPGDRIRLQADAYSAMLEAGQQARANSTARTQTPATQPPQVPATIMLATCDVQCEVGDIVSLVSTTPEFGESDSLDDRAKLQPVLVVERGAAGSLYYASQPWGVVVRPIPAEGVGSVCVAGVAAVKVSFYADGEIFDVMFCSPPTEAQGGPSTVLQARYDGEVKILTKGPYLDGGFTAWCHVLINQQGNRGAFGGLTTTDEWLQWFYDAPTAEHPHGTIDIRHVGPVLHESDPTPVTWVTGASSAAGSLTLSRGSGTFDRRGHLTAVDNLSDIEVDLDALADLTGDDVWIEVTGDIEEGYVVSHIGPSSQANTFTPISGGSATGNQITINIAELGSDEKGHVTGSAAGTPIVITMDDVLLDLVITGDTWIGVAGSATTGYTLTHEGPAVESASADTVASVGLTGTVLTVTGVELGWDTKGHVTGDGAGTGQTVDLQALLGEMTIDGDGTWIDVTGDHVAGYVVEHIGPSTASTTEPGVVDVTFTGTMLTITPADFGYDDKGHIASVVSGTPIDVDIAGVVTSLAIAGDDIWIEFVADGVGGMLINHIGPDVVATTETTVTDASLTGTLLSITPVDIGYDAKGHIVSVAPATPVEVDLADLLGELDITGDDTWISVTGDYSTGYTVSHIGPSTAASNDDTVTADVTGEVLTITPMTIDYDAKGHVVSVTAGTPVEFTDHDEQVAVASGDTPGYLFAKLTAQNAWIELTNNTTNVGIGHADPQAETGSHSTVAASFTAPNLTITPQTVSRDAKGHVRSATAGTPINLDLSDLLGELGLAGDNVWISVTGDATAGYVINHIGPSTTDYTITIDQTDHAQTDDLDFDDTGHNNQADDTITIYDRLVLAHAGDVGGSGYLSDKLAAVDWIDLDIVGNTVRIEHQRIPETDTNETDGTPPGAGFNLKLYFGGGDDWIGFDGTQRGIAFDLQGHFLDGGNGKDIASLGDAPTGGYILALHSDPQSTVRTLSIGGESITIDAKGHVNNDEDWSVDVPTSITDLDDVSDTAPDDGDLLRWNESAGAWLPVTPVEVTVLTDYRVDGANKKLQKKTRTIKVIEAGSESGWTDVHTGADCP